MARWIIIALATVVLFASANQEDAPFHSTEDLTTASEESALREHEQAQANVLLQLQKRDWSSCIKASDADIKGVLKINKATQQSVNSLLGEFLICQAKHCNPKGKKMTSESFVALDPPLSKRDKKLLNSKSQHKLEIETLHNHPLYISMNGCKCARDFDKELKGVRKRESDLKKAAASAKTRYTKALQAPIDVGPKRLKDFDRSCKAFLATSSYKTAKKKAITTHQKSIAVSAAYADAKKATQSATNAAHKEQDTCMCNLKKAIADAREVVRKANEQGHKVWTNAHRELCILRGLSGKKCKVPSYPKVVAPQAAKDIKWPSKCPARKKGKPTKKKPTKKKPTKKKPTKKKPIRRVWGVSRHQDIYTRTGVRGNWQHVKGKLVSIAVAGDGRVWGTNAQHQIFTRTRVGGHWTHIKDGLLKQIAVNAKGHVWGVNMNDDVFSRAGVNGNWVHVKGKLKQIAVNTNGRVWGVNSRDEIYTRPGVGGVWKLIGGRLKQLQAHGNRVWGVSSNHDVFTRTGVGGNWQRIPGKLTRIAVAGDGRVWGVNSIDDIYTRPGVGGNWQHVKGKLKYDIASQ